MLKSIIELFKKGFLILIKNDVLGILIRCIIIFILLFYIGPKFFPLLRDNLIKIELSILLIILLELIVWKPNKVDGETVQKEKPPKDGEQVIINNFVTSRLDQIIKNKVCYLFLHTPSASVGDLLARQNYSSLGIEDLKSKKIELYDNFYNIIISCEISEFNKIIEDNSNNQLKNKIIKYLKKARNPSVSLVITAEDLIKFAQEANGFYKDIYFIMRFINSSLNNKYNINLLIDRISQIKGFHQMFDHDKDGQDLILGVSFIENIANPDKLIPVLREKFQEFLDNLDNKLLYGDIKEIKDYQLCYYFIEQIRASYGYIEKLVDSFAIPEKKFLLKRSKEVLIGLYFMSSTDEKNTVPPIIKRPFQDYIEIAEVNNG